MLDELSKKNLVANLKWDSNQLIPVIIQDFLSLKVLMFAWMNEEALMQTVATNRVHFYSRSRKKQWLKGETSGHFQILKEMNLDCDNDVLLIKVEQVAGIACHTGRESCFYQRWQLQNWEAVEPILKNPEEIY